MPIYKAILFDLDGVLVSACDWHRDALNSALVKHGYEAINDVDHETRFNGLPTLTKLEMLGVTNPGEISKTKQEITLKYIRRRCRYDNAKALLMQRIREKGLLLGVCSNAVRASVDLMLKRTGIFHYFDTILSNEDVVRSKPDPEIYLKAMFNIGVKPEETLIVEDSPKGITAAEASGATVIIVNNPSEVIEELFYDYTG